LGPTIQLIQLAVRFEREAEAERRAAMAYRDDAMDEKMLRTSKWEKRVGGSFKLFHRQPQCECV
jgi:hypothetical protein